jgi:hypothetical protein
MGAVDLTLRHPILQYTINFKLRLARDPDPVVCGYADNRAISLE